MKYFSESSHLTPFENILFLEKFYFFSLKKIIKLYIFEKDLAWLEKNPKTASMATLAID